MNEAVPPVDIDMLPDAGEPVSNRPRTGRLVLPVLLVYFALSSLLFQYWLEPSLSGENNRHIAADSNTYIYFADALREGRLTPYIASALYSFPNTLWGPVSLAFLVPDHAHAMLLLFVLFSACIWIFSRAIDINPTLFLLLLILNPTTTISLLAVNKEIIDLLSLAIFLYYLRSRHHLLLVVALLISLVSRYETFLTMLIFLFFRSNWNPWRNKRWKSLLIYTMFLDVGIALLLSSSTQAYRLEEASGASGAAAGGGGSLLLLNSLEQHFLFLVALVPKLLANLFAEVFNVSHWFLFSSEDPANTFLLFGNNLANLIIVGIVLMRRRLTLRSSLIFYASLIAISMSVSVVVQSRYFYGMYVLLCLEIARRIPRELSETLPGRVDAVV